MTAQLVLERGSRTLTVADAMITIATVSPADLRVHELRALFADDHLHAAVVLDSEGVLLGLLDRQDLLRQCDPQTLAAGLASLSGRTVGPEALLEPIRRSMIAAGRRRLAVVDPDGRFLGLLCLKRTGAGFCSEEDVRARRS